MKPVLTLTLFVLTACRTQQQVAASREFEAPKDPANLSVWEELDIRAARTSGSQGFLLKKIAGKTAGYKLEVNPSAPKDLADGDPREYIAKRHGFDLSNFTAGCGVIATRERGPDLGVSPSQDTLRLRVTASVFKNESDARNVLPLQTREMDILSEAFVYPIPAGKDPFRDGLTVPASSNSGRDGAFAMQGNILNLQRRLLGDQRDAPLPWANLGNEGNEREVNVVLTMDANRAHFESATITVNLMEAGKMSNLTSITCSR